MKEDILTKISKSEPIEPYIDCDGGYFARCERCWTEITPKDKICPKCQQMQDWSWFGKSKAKREEAQ